MEKDREEDWGPVYVIDATKESFVAQSLPGPSTIWNALSQLGKLRVVHYVPVDGKGLDRYNPSLRMLNNAGWIKLEDSHDLIIAKEVKHKKRIRETHKLLREGVIKKAVFEVKGYKLNTVFFFNSLWSHLGRTFNPFAGDFQMGDELSVELAPPLNEKGEMAWRVKFTGRLQFLQTVAFWSINGSRKTAVRWALERLGQVQGPCYQKYYKEIGQVMRDIQNFQAFFSKLQ